MNLDLKQYILFLRKIQSLDLTRYIQTVDSFQQHQLSGVFEQIITGIIAHITQNKFSAYPKLQPYVSCSPQFAQYFASYHSEGRPFTDYATEPDIIINIKDLITAMYLAKCIFAELEQMNLLQGKNPLFDPNRPWRATTVKAWRKGWLAWQKIVPMSYEAARLMTKLDPAVVTVFASEIKFAQHILAEVQGIPQQIEEKTTLTPQAVQKLSAPNNVGHMVGQAVHQLKPDCQDIDIPLLAGLSGAMPEYLSTLSAWLRQKRKVYLPANQGFHPVKLMHFSVKQIKY